MRGCSDRAALSSSEAYASSRAGEPGASAAAGPTGTDTLMASLGVTAPLATAGQVAAAAVAGGSGGAAEPEATAKKQQQQMWGLMGFGGLFIDNYQLPPDAADQQVSQPVTGMLAMPVAGAAVGPCLVKGGSVRNLYMVGWFEVRQQGAVCGHMCGPLRRTAERRSCGFAHGRGGKNGGDILCCSFPVPPTGC